MPLLSSQWQEDGTAAVENLPIAATALGYGSCWLEGYTLRREQKFKALSGIPDGRRLLTLVPIGVPAKWPTKEKKPLEEVVRWERYQIKHHASNSTLRGGSRITALAV